MRIISGALGGRRLRAPAGTQTRPTADAVREALFNILLSPGGRLPQGAWALDLFAGSGALGLEALSRGVERVVFVESDRAACRVLKRNLQVLGLTSRAEILERPVRWALSALTSPFHFVFADPPYDDPALEETLAQLGQPSCPLLLPDSIVVVEHRRRKAAGDLPGPAYGALRRHGERCYGQTALSFYAPGLV